MSPRAADPFRVLAALAFRNARILTIVFAYVFAVYALVQPLGYRNSYPALANRLAFAHSFADNTGLRLLYGQPHDITTVAGYSAWRVGGILSVAAAAFGLLTVVGGLRADEDSGRMEVVLAENVSRHTANLAALSAIAAGIGLLWLAELAGFLFAGLPPGGSVYLALSTVTVAPVFVGLGALVSQLAATRGVALGMGGALLGLLFVLRVVADTVAGTGWLRWITPLGWTELMRPFADARPLVMLLPVTLTGLLIAVSARLAASRDIGTGLLPARDSVDPALRLLSSPTAQSLRSQLPSLTAWVGAVAVFTFVLGVVSQGMSPADIPHNVQDKIAKLGVGSIATPPGYLAFVFLFVIVAGSAFACAQVGAARREEAGQQLETLLAQPVSRARWMAGRLLIAMVGAVAVSLSAALSAWAGAAVAGAHVSLLKMFEAGGNVLPTAMLFLGVAALAFAVLPRFGSGIGYSLLTATFLWQLIGSLLGPPRWLLDLTPFAHVGLVPAQPFHAVAAATLVGIGVLAGITAVSVFGRRDLFGK